MGGLNSKNSPKEQNVIKELDLTYSPASKELPKHKLRHPKFRKIQIGKKTNGNTSLRCFNTNATSLVKKWDKFNSLVNTCEIYTYINDYR